MIEGLPTYIYLLFGLTVIISIAGLYISTGSRMFLIFATGWVALQSVIGLQGIYQDTVSMPPRIMLLGVFPPLLVITVTFLTRHGRSFIDSTDLRALTYLHAIRIPVEVVLLILYYYGLVSVFMTFEGTNFDLFSGITAPVVAFIAFRGGITHKKLLLWWNIICLLLLLNVVITAVFAVPSPFQLLAFGQPNIAVLYFPFNLLPTVIVPIVLFAHLAAISRLIKGNRAVSAAPEAEYKI